MAARTSRECANLISFQSGVLARWQIAGREADLRSIKALLRSGRWQFLYHGVYAAFTGRPPRDSAVWAAVLRCGPEAMLSHFTAAELDGFADDPRDAVHVTVPALSRVQLSCQDNRPGLPRIMVHRSRRAADIRHPVKTPPRTRLPETVLDLTELAQTFDAAFGWMSLACGRRLATPDQLREAAVRRSRMRWRADVLAATEEISAGVQSNLELGFVRKVERPHRLPQAQRQAMRRNRGHAAYLDNHYGEFGLAVELDGLAAHPAETRWLDMRRDSFMAATGVVTLRYTWADISTRPCLVAREIGQVLRQRGWQGTLRSCNAACEASLL